MKATLAVGHKPDAIAWDPATRTAWVMNAGSGDISVINPVAAKVVAAVPVGGSLELGAADGQGRLYVNVEDRNEVAVLDTRARKLVTRFPLAGCDGPTGIAFDARDRQVLSVCANGVAKVSDVNGREVASLPIGPRPDGAAFDAVRGVALAPPGGSGTLAVIRLGAQSAVVQTLATARGARTIALDPSSAAPTCRRPHTARHPPAGTSARTPRQLRGAGRLADARAMTAAQKEALSKAPPAILMFWVVKICATTVGETGGDAVSMTLKLGYLAATLIFLMFFASRSRCRSAPGATIRSSTGWWWWRRPRSAPPPATSSTAPCTWATSLPPPCCSCWCWRCWSPGG